MATAALNETGWLAVPCATTAANGDWDNGGVVIGFDALVGDAPVFDVDDELV